MTFKTVAFTIYVLRRYGEYLWRGRRWRPTDDFAVRFLYPHSAEHCAESLHLSNIEIVESDVLEELSMATTLRSGLPALSRLEGPMAIRSKCEEKTYP